MQQQQQIKLKLDVEEVNIILEGLGSLPYAKVYGVVANIQQQAQKQLQASDNSSKTEANGAAKKMISETEVTESLVS